VGADVIKGEIESDEDDGSFGQRGGSVEGASGDRAVGRNGEVGSPYSPEEKLFYCGSGGDQQRGGGLPASGFGCIRIRPGRERKDPRCLWGVSDGTEVMRSPIAGISVNHTVGEDTC
jgi:hypothetical protein